MRVSSSRKGRGWRWGGTAATLLGACTLVAGCAHGRLPELPRSEWANAPRWPLPPNEMRIVWVGELRSGDDIVASGGFFGWLTDLVVGKSDSDALSWPLGIAVDERGRIAVADPGLGALVVFDPSSGQTMVLRDTAVGELVSPVGTAIDDDGNFYVSDSALGIVARFDEDGEPIDVIGQGVLQRPTGLALRPENGELWVVDTGSHTVVAFGRDGRWLGSFGERGESDGQLNFPVFVTITPGGDAWIVDSMNARVQRFDRAGRFQSVFGGRGDSAGSFAHPKGIATDSDGHLYVADALFDNVQIFDDTGRLLLVFGGRGVSQGDLHLPEGIAIDRQDRIFVADALNHRIQIFRYIGNRGDP